MGPLKQYEPKVFNDIDMIIHGREAKWNGIQRRQAHWTTRGGYLENAKGSRQDLIARMKVFAIFVVFAIGFIKFCATMAK